MANRTVSVNLVANVGQYVGGMNQAAASTMRLGESADVSSKKAQSGFDLAGKSSLIMGAAIVGGLALAIGKSMEFEKSMSAAQAATLATGSALDGLRATAIKAGADTQYSATEAADAITEMGKAGVSAKDIMDGGLTGALNLAAAGQLDVAEAAGIAATAMVQFGLAGDQIPHVADLLAAGAGKAMGSVEDLAGALKYVGPVAAGMGISIEETTGTLALFASQGILSEQAGTSMRGMLTALTSPSKLAAQTMSELGISVFDASGNFIGMGGVAEELHDSMANLTEAERSEALGRIFGNEQITAARVLYQGGAAAVEDWTKKVNDSGYAQEQAAKLTDNLSGDLERLGGSFDTLMISLGSGAQGPLRELVQMLGGLVDGVAWAVEAFSSLPGPVQTAVVAVAAFAALRGPMAGFFTMLEVKAVLGADKFLALALSVKTLQTALTGVTLAAATWGITKAVDEVVDFTHAGDNAQEMVDNLSRSLGGMKGPDKLEATRAAVEQLRGELSKYKVVVDSYEDQGWFNKFIWQNPFGNLNDVKDARESLDIVKNKIAELESQGTNSFFQIGESVRGAADVIAGATGGVDSAVSDTVANLEDAKKAQEDWLNSLQDIGTAFVEPLSVYTGLLQEKSDAEREAAEKTAASTESSKDSWKDYVGNVSVSLDEYATKLEEHIVAQENWRANILTITQRGGLEVGQAIAAMGAEGIQLAAQMANGTDAEFQRMAALIVRDAQNGGAGAAAALDSGMKFMDAVARQGAAATRQSIAEELGMGVGQVQAIADQYGVALATGINPVLASIGKKVITINQQAGRRYIGLNEYAEGGYTGPGGKYTPAGIVHAGEFVFPQHAVDRIGVDNLAAMAGLPGYADGGFVNPSDVPQPYSTSPYRPPISAGADATMQKGFDEVRGWLEANVSVGPTAGAGVQRWAPVVLQALAMVGQPASLLQTVLRRMQQESGGNPRAINLTDSNAKRGTPSKGLMQVIDPTFRAYAMAGHNSDIWDPLSNILASERYAMARYGSLSAAYNKAGGYASGGVTPAGDPFWVGEGGPELMWSSREKYVTSAARSREFAGSSGPGAGSGSGGGAGRQAITLQLDGRAVTELLQGHAVKVVTDFATMQTDRGRNNG